MGEQAIDDKVASDAVAGGRPALQTTPCSLCGRKFLPERLAKHMTICKKTSQKKRQPFNSKAQRLLGDETVPPNTPASGSESDSNVRRQTRSRVTGKTSAATSGSESTGSPKAGPKSHWREQHEEFLRTVRAARGEKVDDEASNRATTVDADGSIVEQKKVPPGYVTCPHCDRNFSKGAAERHIPWCAEQKARVVKKDQEKVATEAMARFKARSQYKAPGVRRGSKDSVASTPVTSAKSTHVKVPGPMVAKKVLPPEARHPGPAAPKAKVNGSVGRSTSRARPADKKGPINGGGHQGPAVANGRTKSQSPLRKGKFPPPINTQPSRVKALLMENEAKQAPRTPVIKFKDRFPDRKPVGNGATARIIQETTAEMQELFMRPDTMSNLPRTVPGKRTGGLSPTKSTTVHGSLANIHDPSPTMDTGSLTARLKSRLEDVYIQSSLTGNGLPTNGLHEEANGVRGSTSGSSTDGAELGLNRSRNNSDDGGGGRGSKSGASSTIGSGLPRFCHQCGTKYPSGVAKYCYECGARRLGTAAAFLT